MALSKEKIAEIQTIAHLLEKKLTPTTERITQLYDDYLSALNAPSPENPELDAENARIMAQRRDKFSRKAK